MRRILQGILGLFLVLAMGGCFPKKENDYKVQLVALPKSTSIEIYFKPDLRAKLPEVVNGENFNPVDPLYLEQVVSDIRVDGLDNANKKYENIPCSFIGKRSREHEDEVVCTLRMPTSDFKNLYCSQNAFLRLSTKLEIKFHKEDPKSVDLDMSSPKLNLSAAEFWLGLNQIQCPSSLPLEPREEEVASNSSECLYDLDASGNCPESLEDMLDDGEEDLDDSTPPETDDGEGAGQGKGSDPSATDPDPEDLDGDGIKIAEDNCPSDSNPPNAEGIQDDADGDGYGDVCDACDDQKADGFLGGALGCPGPSAGNGGDPMADSGLPADPWAGGGLSADEATGGGCFQIGDSPMNNVNLLVVLGLLINRIASRSLRGRARGR